MATRELPADDYPFGYDGRDLRLTEIIRRINSAKNDAGNLFPTTVTAGGSIVTGFLVSDREWFDLNAEELRQTASADDHEKLEILDMYIELFVGSGGAAKSDPDDPMTWPRFIHMKGAAYVTPNGMVPADQGMLWRGRIDQVDGWSFGNFLNG